MKFKTMPLKAISTITLSTLLLVACDDTRVRISADTGHGYSAPRGHSHGGRLTRTPHNHRVSFDEALGMYIVLGLANTYWNNGSYYRYDNRGWQSSRDYRRWSRMQQSRIPAPLYKRHNRRAATTYHNNNRVKIVRPGRSRSNVNWNY